MKFFRLLLLLVACSPSTAQTPAPQPPQSASPNPQATLAYIHAVWDTLTRSQTECASLADSKVTTVPILYLPAELPAPPEVQTLTQKCHIQVMRLPRRIEKIGDLRPGDLPAEGLLYLPHPYVVPGGRFNEMYGWDSYFIVLGLEADRRPELAKDMVDNFLFEIEHYGAVLNANRTYYLTRSQPPFLTSMIRAVYENPASFPATFAGRAEARAWLLRAYTLAQKDYSVWTEPGHRAGLTGLSRYFDYGSGPVPEMADDATYYIDVLRWMVSHLREGGTRFVVKASEHPDDAEAARLKQASCDIHTSVVCSQAWFGGYRLTKDFYSGDRAMRESGFDPSFRFGPFSGETHHYAPVCLNSLLFRYARDLQHFALLLGKPAQATRWERHAQTRLNAMQRYLWQPKSGVYADYDFTRHKASTYAFVTSLYPLWAGVATRQQARQMVAHLDLFARPGGLSMSAASTGLQWDEPFGWAPTNWIAVSGLDRSGYRADAQRIARTWNATVDNGFAQDGTLREKYNVVRGNADVRVKTGYSTNEIGFGWTNAVYLKMLQVIDEPAAVGNK